MYFFMGLWIGGCLGFSLAAILAVAKFTDDMKGVQRILDGTEHVDPG